MPTLSANITDMAAKTFRTREEYGDKFEEHVLEQYRLFVDTEERLVSRRQEENRFFLSVNSLLLAVLSLLLSQGIDAKETAIAVAILGGAGLALCYAWWSIIDSYKKLNEAKFVIIDEFEKQVPVRMFGVEWEAANERGYQPFTRIERQVPFVFGGLNFVAGAIGVLGLLDVVSFS